MLHLNNSFRAYSFWRGSTSGNLIQILHFGIFWLKLEYNKKLPYIEQILLLIFPIELPQGLNAKDFKCLVYLSNIFFIKFRTKIRYTVTPFCSSPQFFFFKFYILHWNFASSLGENPYQEKYNIEYIFGTIYQTNNFWNTIGYKCWRITNLQANVLFHMIS